MSTHNNKMAMQMAIYTACIAFLIASFLSIISIHISFQSLLNKQASTIQSLQLSTIPAFDIATFDYNLPLNQQLVDGLISHPDIASAIVIDRRGQKLASGEQRHSCIPNPFELLLFPDSGIHISSLSHNDTVLGKLILEIDRCTLLNDFHLIAKKAIFYSLLATLLISAFMYLAFYFKVTRPIASLVKEIATIDPNNLEKTDLTSVQTDQPDEVGMLIRQFITLIDMLKTEGEKQHQHDITINEYSNQLEKLIHKRTSALTTLNRRLLQSQELLRNPTALQSRLGTLMLLLNQPIQELIICLTERNPEEALALSTQLDQLVTDLLIIQEQSIKNSDTLINIKYLATQCIHKIEKNRDIILICDIEYEIFLPYECVRVLISGLLSNAITKCKSSPLHLHIRPEGQHLSISIFGDDLHITKDEFNNDLLPLNAEYLNLPSSIGLGLLTEVCLLLGGSLSLNAMDRKDQVLYCILPLISRQQLLQKLKSYFSKQTLALNIASDQWTDEVTSLLNEWKIPFTNEAPKSDQLLITDSFQYNHKSEFTFIGTQTNGKWPNNSDIFLALLNLVENHAKLTNTRVQILLVDDNTINRMLSQRYLKNLHITPDIAGNGLQALEKAQRKRYDLILMDCQMPVMDGFEATRKIRKSSLNQETPIIALTGLTGDHERKNCLAVGMNDFIGKPFTQDQIHAALIQWINHYGYIGE